MRATRSNQNQNIYQSKLPYQKSHKVSLVSQIIIGIFVNDKLSLRRELWLHMISSSTYIGVFRPRVPLQLGTCVTDYVTMIPSISIFIIKTIKTDVYRPIPRVWKILKPFLFLWVSFYRLRRAQHILSPYLHCRRGSTTSRSKYPSLSMHKGCIGVLTESESTDCHPDLLPQSRVIENWEGIGRLRLWRHSEKLLW